MNKILTIWFDDQGNLIEVARHWRINGYNSKSEPGLDFTDTMNYLGFRGGGKSASRLLLRSTVTGREYSMFLDDFDQVIKANLFINNIIDGLFRFTKKGQAQAVKLVLPAP